MRRLSVLSPRYYFIHNSLDYKNGIHTRTYKYVYTSHKNGVADIIWNLYVFPYTTDWNLSDKPVDNERRSKVLNMGNRWGTHFGDLIRFYRRRYITIIKYAYTYNKYYTEWLGKHVPIICYILWNVIWRQNPKVVAAVKTDDNHNRQHIIVYNNIILSQYRYLYLIMMIIAVFVRYE